MEFYKCEIFCEHVTKIEDLSGVHAFLVEGSQKAALLDTCCGLGDLQATVSNLTQLPLVTICTHGHTDHAGGTYGFDPVFLNENDSNLVKIHTTVEFRKGYIDSMLPPGTVKSEDFMPQRESGYQNLFGGQVFDLGGLTLEAIPIPGHTQGMMGILIREIRTLLLGDGCNSMTFLFSPEACSVEAYRASLQNLNTSSDCFDTVLFSHGHNKGSKVIIDEAIELCGDIMNHQSDNVPFNFMGQTAYIAREINPTDFSRIDGKTANIVYNPERIFEEVLKR